LYGIVFGFVNPDLYKIEFLLKPHQFSNTSASKIIKMIGKNSIRVSDRGTKFKTKKLNVICVLSYADCNANFYGIKEVLSGGQ